MLAEALLRRIDESRRREGLLTPAELMEGVGAANVVHDPFSTLVARGARIGRANVLFPCVSILGHGVSLGDGNVLHAQTLLQGDGGDDGGTVTVGDRNQLGAGGFVACARRGERVEIGSGGRYLHGVSVYGTSVLGSGSQVLGRIVVESCRLAAGGTFEEPDPDKRGGVLKGVGRARGLAVGLGEVVAGAGEFRQQDLRRQLENHPRA